MLINERLLVGGGTKNKLLCQFTANATQIPVIAGPIEATAIGNILMQAIAEGEIPSIKNAREIVRDSYEIKVYKPQNSSCWEEAYQRYLKNLD
ncbi:MAG: FGGY-family carbohydrate kinase [Candidatus Firestonebacteria bacterium]